MTTSLILLVLVILVGLPLKIGIDRWYFLREEFKQRSLEGYPNLEWGIYRACIRESRKKGTFLFCLERLFLAFEYLSPFQLSFYNNPHVNEMLKWSGGLSKQLDEKRAGAVDIYLYIIWASEILLLNFGIGNRSCIIWPILFVFIPVRLFDIFQTTLNQTIFNGLRYQKWTTTSNQRNLLIALVSYFEIAVLFGFAYHMSGWLAQGQHETPVPLLSDAIYFSFASQFTIGYGDIHPLGIARNLVIFHTCLTLPLVAIIVVRGVNSIPGIKEREQ